jgi:hypothetical protein
MCLTSHVLNKEVHSIINKPPDYKDEVVDVWFSSSREFKNMRAGFVACKLYAVKHPGSTTWPAHASVEIDMLGKVIVTARGGTVTMSWDSTLAKIQDRETIESPENAEHTKAASCVLLCREFEKDTIEQICEYQEQNGLKYVCLIITLDLFIGTILMAKATGERVKLEHAMAEKSSAPTRDKPLVAMKGGLLRFL